MFSIKYWTSKIGRIRPRPTNSQGQRSWKNHPSVDSPPSCPLQLFPNFGHQQNNYENHLHSESQGCHQNMMSFDGDIMKWTQFWDLFEGNNDKNRTLSDVNKFQYSRTLEFWRQLKERVKERSFQMRK